MQRKYNLLIVEDEKQSQQALFDILHEMYTLFKAETSQEARRFLCDGTPIDLILLSERLPKWGSSNLLEFLHEDANLCSIPVLMVTPIENYEKAAVLPLGVSDLVLKPYNPELLRLRIEKALKLADSDQELQKAEARANSDPLTGLSNRAGFEKAVDAYFSQNPGGSASLLMLDLDDFKKINDVYGHPEGDRALLQISAVLKALFREQDTIARIGGDEFAVFCPSLTSSQLLAKRMESTCKRISALHFLQPLSCTIGACRSPQHGQDYSSLYLGADRALLAAKRLGKNQFQIYGDDSVSSAPFSNHSIEWLLDEIDEGVLISERATHELLYLNRAACQIAGKEMQECLGTPCYKTLWGRSSPCPFCVSCELLESGMHECSVDPLHNKKRYYIKTRLIEWDGRPARLQYLSDITEKVHLQQQIDGLLATSKAARVKCTADGSFTVLEANDRFYELCGYSREEFHSLCGNSLQGLLGENDIETLRALCRLRLSQHEPVVNHCRFLKKGGASVAVLEVISLEESAEGEPVCVHFYTEQP